MFDLYGHEYSRSADDFLRNQTELNTARLSIVKGDSTETVVSYVAAHPGFKCDLLSVDGGHSYDIAKRDITNMAALANETFNVLLVDDTNCPSFSHCVDKAFGEHVAEGRIERYDNGSFNLGFKKHLGLTVARYIKF